MSSGLPPIIINPVTSDEIQLVISSIATELSLAVQPSHPLGQQFPASSVPEGEQAQTLNAFASECSGQGNAAHLTVASVRAVGVFH